MPVSATRQLFSEWNIQEKVIATFLPTCSIWPHSHGHIQARDLQKKQLLDSQSRLLELLMCPIGVPSCLPGIAPTEYVAVTYQRTNPSMFFEVFWGCLPALLGIWFLKQSKVQLGGILSKKKFNFAAAKKVMPLFPCQAAQRLTGGRLFGVGKHA